MLKSDHRWTGKRLQLYCDGELAVSDIDRLLAHLADCHDCEREVRLLLDMKESLRRIGALSRNT